MFVLKCSYPRVEENVPCIVWNWNLQMNAFRMSTNGRVFKMRGFPQSKKNRTIDAIFHAVYVVREEIIAITTERKRIKWKSQLFQLFEKYFLFHNVLLYDIEQLKDFMINLLLLLTFREASPSSSTFIFMDQITGSSKKETTILVKQRFILHTYF